MDGFPLEDLRLARAARDDSQAAAALLRRIHPRVVAVVHAAAAGGADVEELVQTSLAEALQSVGNYRGAGTLESWAGQLTFHTVMRLLKRQRRRERTMVAAANEPRDGRPDPEAAAARAQMWERLATGLGSLPEERRATLLLRVIHERSVPEIAELTGVSVNTVKDRLRTGLRELRALFARDAALREGMREAGHE